MTDSKQRIEAFSDGVVAIIITIMVLGIQLPADTGWVEVKKLLKDIMVFLASFAVVGMFWDRHRQMFAYLEHVSGKLVWRNMLFLAVLAIIPIFTRWAMLHPERTVPVLGYGVAFLAVNFASTFLFSAAIPLFDEQARKVMAMRPHIYGFMFAIGAGVVLIAAGAFFLPRLSTWLLVGYPILMALVGLWLEQPHMDRVAAARREHRRGRRPGRKRDLTSQ